MAEQNQLEKLLSAAATDPAARPAFYRELLRADLFVIGTVQPDGDGERASIAHFDIDGDAIPIFTSLEMMSELIHDDQPYLGVEGRKLFEMLRGQRLVINPGGQFGKELLPDEVNSLLDGSLLEPGEARKIPAGTVMAMGQPAEYPEELVGALSRLFLSRGDVAAAYLAQVGMPGDEPHPVIGLRCDGDPATLFQEASVVCRELKKKLTVDFVQIRPDEDLSEYMVQETKPFFTRSKK